MAKLTLENSISPFRVNPMLPSHKSQPICWFPSHLSDISFKEQSHTLRWRQLQEQFLQLRTFLRTKPIKTFLLREIMMDAQLGRSVLEFSCSFSQFHSTLVMLHLYGVQSMLAYMSFCISPSLSVYSGFQLLHILLTYLGFSKPNLSAKPSSY
jgi:hypothetical protein